MLSPIVACFAAVMFMAPEESPPGLKPEHLYNGVNRPVMIEVTSPRSFGTVQLVLMDANGEAVAPPVEVRPGRVDLAEVLPDIWGLKRAAYLQMLDLNQPVGPALVLQPMLSRMVPMTEIKPHPTRGHLHSSIVGWKDENDPEMLAPRLCSGLRVYLEEDVILHTTHGDIRLALRADEAPNTAWNFLELSRGGFYRNVVFHRIVPLTANGDPFVIQAGDPTGSGDGGPGYWLPIEPSALPHDFGVVSMARADAPDSAGSQFFICLSREGTARLDGQYCAFGYAVSGAETINAIADVELADAASGRPVHPPVITAAELLPAPPRTPGIGRPDTRVTRDAAAAQPKPNHVPR